MGTTTWSEMYRHLQKQLEQKKKLGKNSPEAKGERSEQASRIHRPNQGSPAVPHLNKT